MQKYTILIIFYTQSKNMQLNLLSNKTITRIDNFFFTIVPKK